MFLTSFSIISSCGSDQADAKVETHATDKATPVRLGYNLGKVVKIEMKKKLKEISGIHYLKDDLLAAIQDESGKIFTVNFTNGEIIKELEFGGKGDYEDLTLDDEFYYVLESSGKIYKVPRSGDISNTRTYEIPFQKKMEFESIFLDRVANKLLMICKNCPGKKNNALKYAYAFDIKEATFADDPVFSVDVSVLPASVNFEGTDIKPSASAIHPLENKLYLLCSVGKVLLICDLNGKIEQALALNPEIYNQPEGITFSPNGDMYISNEAGDNDQGNILQVKYE